MLVTLLGAFEIWKFWKNLGKYLSGTTDCVPCIAFNFSSTTDLINISKFYDKKQKDKPATTQRNIRHCVKNQNEPKIFILILLQVKLITIPPSLKCDLNFLNMVQVPRTWFEHFVWKRWMTFVSFEFEVQKRYLFRNGWNKEDRTAATQKWVLSKQAGQNNVSHRIVDIHSKTLENYNTLGPY